MQVLMWNPTKNAQHLNETRLILTLDETQTTKSHFSSLFSCSCPFPSSTWWLRGKLKSHLSQDPLVGLPSLARKSAGIFESINPSLSKLQNYQRRGLDTLQNDPDISTVVSTERKWWSRHVILLKSWYSYVMLYILHVKLYLLQLFHIYK